MIVTDISPPVDNVSPSLDTRLALSISTFTTSSHGPEVVSVHRVVVDLVILVQESIVHRKLLFSLVQVVGPMRDVSVCMNVLIGPVILGVREWFLVVVVLEIVPDTWRSRLHNQVISDGPILKQRKCKTFSLFAISRRKKWDREHV